MDNKTAKTGVRTEPDIMRAFKIAYTKRGETSQAVLYKAVLSYIKETESLEKEGLLKP